MKKKLSKDQVARKFGFKSGLEEKISEQLQSENLPVNYETDIIEYIIPESKHKYKPDFKLIKKDGSNMYIETKGRLVFTDSKKLILVKKQHPELDIRIVFQYSKNKIRKGSKTTYGDWATKHGFIWAEKQIPKEWLKE